VAGLLIENPRAARHLRDEFGAHVLGIEVDVDVAVAAQSGG